MGFNDLRKKTGSSTSTDGSSGAAITSPLTAFGDLQVAQLSPVAQGDFVYSINPLVFVTRTFDGGTATISDNMAQISSGTNTLSSATIQTRRGLKYRPGQGSLARMTALFDTPSAGNAQFVGTGNSESGYFIGYFGLYFGILHNPRASREIRAYQVTAGVANGTSVSITLNGNTPIVTTINGGSNVYRTAYEISKVDFSNVGSGGWLTDVIGDTVYFIAARTGASADYNYTYSITGTGLTGTFTRYQIASAADPTEQTFITQANFNIDPLDGSGPSGMTLDPQKGNVYQIGFQYLGFGNARFGIEDPETGRIFDFHMIKNANNRTFPVLKNPNVSILATSANIGGTTSKTIKTSSIAGYVQGKIIDLDPIFAKTFIFKTDTSKNAIGLVKINKVFHNKSCFGEIDLIKISASNLSSSSADLRISLYIGETLSGKDVNFENFDTNNSIVSIASGNESSGGSYSGVYHAITTTTKPVFEITVGSNSSRTETFVDSRFSIGIGQVVMIVVESTSSGINGQVTFTWYEQQ